MLVRTIHKAVDEFEIKQVIRNRNIDEGNSSKSLVFKISKRTSKQQGLTDGHNVTSNHSILIKEPEVSAPLNSILCLASETNPDGNISIKNRNKTGAAGDTVDTSPREIQGQVTAVNVSPVIRRTSKRIYLRKSNFEVSIKTSADKKIKDPSSETAKQGPNYSKMGRRKGSRKTLSAAGDPKCEVVRRGPGRPRTVNRDQPLEKSAKNVPTQNLKTPKESLVVANDADSSSVWTLVPKELANSDYFKSHIMKLHQKTPRGRKPKKILSHSYIPEIPRISFSSRDNMKVQFPKMPPVMSKSSVQQPPVPSLATPSRPTVIYFKTPNNGLGEMEKNPPVSSQINFPAHQHVPPEELQLSSSYPRQNYGNKGNDPALGYFHGFFQKNMKRDDQLIRDIISGRKQITADCYTYSNQQYHLQSHRQMCQENKIGPSNEFVLQSNGYDRVPESPPEPISSYISCRQVIADSIRLLYDDESVLGYA